MSEPLRLHGDRDRAPITFEGQTAIVTGAGHGLGRSYARELAARGAAVVCNDVDADAADDVTREIARRGGRAVAETSSVASAAGGAAIVAAAIDAFGSVEIVVNNAGQLRNRAFEEMTASDFDDVLRTHLAGAFYVTQPAYRHMRAAGYGRIVFTSSSAGLFGSPWQANYAAAKAGTPDESSRSAPVTSDVSSSGPPSAGTRRAFATSRRSGWRNTSMFCPRCPVSSRRRR